MTEQAAPTPAPAAAPNGASAPEQLHAGQSFHEFQQQVQDRLKAAQPQGQPPGAPKTVAPQPKPLAEIQQQAALEAAKLDQPVPDPGSKTLEQTPAELDPNAPPAEAQPPEGTPQVSKEDLDLLAKFKAWMAGESIPEDLLAKLPVPLKNGEEIEYESLDEVRAGRMRQREFIRSQQKFDQERQQWAQEKGFYEGHFNAIFSDENEGAAGGDAMYEIYTRAGKRRQLLALGKKLALEEQEDIDGANGAGYAVMNRLGVKDPKDYRVQEAIKREWERRQRDRESGARSRALEFENQRLKQQTEQRQQENQSQEHWATQRKALEQLRPRAFEALGLAHDNPLHRQTFDMYLNAVIQQEKVNKVTPELVMKAARAAMEELKEGRKGPGPAPAARGFQPQLAGGAAPIKGAQPKQWHAETFAEQFKMPRW